MATLNNLTVKGHALFENPAAEDNAPMRKKEFDEAIALLALATHNHNDLYNTKAEIVTLLAGKAAATHNHNDLYNTKAEIVTLLAGKAAASHDHDDLYNTKEEIVTLLAGKAAASHNHDGEYAQLDSFNDAIAEYLNSTEITDLVKGLFEDSGYVTWDTGGAQIALALNWQTSAGGLEGQQGIITVVGDKLTPQMGLATDTLHGLLSKTDKAKLDTVDPATISGNAAAIAAIQTTLASFAENALAAAVAGSENTTTLEWDDGNDTLKAAVRLKAQGAAVDKGSILSDGDGLYIPTAASPGYAMPGNWRPADASSSEKGLQSIAHYDALQGLIGVANLIDKLKVAWPVHHSQFIPAELWADPAGNVDYGFTTTGASYDSAFKVARFSHTQVESVQALVHLPTGWSIVAGEGGKVRVRLLWSTGGATGGGVAWNVYISGIVGTEVGGWGTPGHGNESIANSSEIIQTDVSKTPENLGDRDTGVIVIKIERDTDQASDTLGEDALLLGVIVECSVSGPQTASIRDEILDYPYDTE